MKDVGALQTNFFITNLMDVVNQPVLCRGCLAEHSRPASKCMECEEYLCEQCVKAHQALEKTKDHNIVALSPENESGTLVCPNHDGNSLCFYCTACETAVCEDCTAVEHIGHKTISLQEAIEDHKSVLTTRVEGARKQIPHLERSIEMVTNISESLLAKCQSAEAQIIETFDDLSKLLNNRKCALLGELAVIHGHKNQILNDQKNTLETVLSKITNGCRFTEQTLLHGSETEILLLKKEMSEKLNELGCQVHNQPEENDCLIFDSSQLQVLRKTITNAGTIKSNSAVAFETTANGEGLKTCYIGQPTIITVTTKDRKGELIKVGGSTLISEIRDEDGSIVFPSITDHQNGTYEISFVIQSEGKYDLDIRLYGMHIKGAPFKIKAVPGGEELDHFGTSSKIPRTVIKQKGTKRPPSSRSHGSNRRSNPIEDDLLLRVGVKGRNKGEFTNPQGIHAVNSKILVADSNNQNVQVFSATGDCKLRFGAPGRVAGKMQRPTGVAATVNGNYLVADYDNKWISVYSPDGKYINKIGTGKLLGPKGVGCR
ncbi:hypothetical protein KUTeg_024041 [Tegillarca granosa]|uniref:B box-type domain-containing protein n=1 Tax=Tegillarca granosa TaxID=220873 RepID=A0ABQ9E1W2_TEGGR|nr:hypothetical protein KUTeg_024041 [Tegillarca granosa]